MNGRSCIQCILEKKKTMAKPTIENLKAVRKYIKDRPNQDPLVVFQDLALYHVHQLKYSYKDELKKKDEHISNLEKQLLARARPNLPVMPPRVRLANPADMHKLKATVEELPVKNTFERSTVPVMYLIIRESLGMSPGKIAAQVGHGVMQMVDRYYKKKEKANYAGLDNPSFYLILRETVKYYEEWRKEPTKVVLKATEAQWDELKNFDCEVVVDGGFTEIPANSETVLAFWPMRKDLAPALIKSLPLV